MDIIVRHHMMIQWLRRFPKERFVCKYERELASDWMILIAFGLATRHGS